MWEAFISTMVFIMWNLVKRLETFPLLRGWSKNVFIKFPPLPAQCKRGRPNSLSIRIGNEVSITLYAFQESKNMLTHVYSTAWYYSGCGLMWILCFTWIFVYCRLPVKEEWAIFILLIWILGYSVLPKKSILTSAHCIFWMKGDQCGHRDSRS